MNLKNQNRVLILFSFFLTLSSHVLAKTAGVDDLKCAITKSAFEVPTRITSGAKKFSGQCIDSKRFRPAIITSLKKSEYLVFENYLHKNKYWKARLSKKAVVEAIYVQVIRFNIVSGITAGHVQLRVKFASHSEIELTSESKSIKVDDIIVSYEAARPKGIDYNFALGVVDNYLLVGRVASGDQRLLEYSKENKTEQYKLNLSQEESLKLLLSALESSHNNKFKKFYNTLKPNCTTEIFDLIDQLPSQKLKGTVPFLTMISNDPVAGPTIQALSERGILEKRFADLRDEKNGITKPPLKEDTPESKLGLFVDVPGYPYALVLAVSEETDSPVLRKAKKLAYSMAPQLVQRLASNLMLSEADSLSFLLGSLKSLGPVLKEQLKKINTQLTDEPLTLALYLTPWDNKLGKNIDALKDLGVQARLPFEIFETHFDVMSMNEIHTGLNDAANLHAQNKKSFGLIGLSVQLHLVKNKSIISLQALGRLGSFEKDLIIKHEQVNIKKFIIPEGLVSWSQPVGLLTLSQNMIDPVPSLNISFGNLGKLNEDESSTKFGQLRIHNNKYECATRRGSTPKIKGDAAQFSLINVFMDIFSLDVDLEKARISNMDIRISTGLGILKNCESNPEINKLFTDRVNSKINDKNNKFKKSPGLNFLSQILSNNKEGEVSGFIKH